MRYSGSWLAAPMPEGGLLGPPADLVDHRVGQPDGVEVVHHHGGVAKRGDQRAGIAAPGVQRDRADAASQSRGRALSQPSTAALVRSATTSSSRPRSRVDQAGDLPGRRHGGWPSRKLVSSSPSAATPSRRVRVVHQRVAVLAPPPA